MRMALVLVAAGLAWACASSADDSAAGSAPAFTGMQAIEDHDVQNLIHVSPRIFSGAAPDGEEAFAALVARGVKTIVSVDGARPDIEGARKYGLRYVHIPISYDGVPDEAALQIEQVLTETKGPVYIHCHHGQHRGPAAAAVALRLETNCSGTEAADLLRLAKTDPKYKGLWSDVENFQRAPAGTPRPKLQEVAEVGDFVEAMVKLDADWDRLKILQAAAWKVPADHPDLVPAKEAKILAETLAAMDRAMTPEQKADQEFLRLMLASQKAAPGLQAALEAGDTTAAEQGFAAVKKSCADCHKVYRD